MTTAALKPRWCVAWKHPKTGKTEWCATYRGRKPEPTAMRDRTACGAHVIMRCGSMRRLPTCVVCLELMREAAKRREAAHA